MRITFAHHSTNGSVEGVTIEATKNVGIAYNTDYYATTDGHNIEIGAKDLKKLTRWLKTDSNSYRVSKFD